jgi:hypothetical protein
LVNHLLFREDGRVTEIGLPRRATEIRQECFYLAHEANDRAAGIV